MGYRNGGNARMRPRGLMVLGQQSTPTTWTSMPAVETEFLGQSVRRSIELSGFTQFRIAVAMGTVAGFAGSVLSAKYTAQIGDALVDLGDSGDVAISNSSTCTVGAWTDIPEQAKADVFVQITGKGGNGAVSPRFVFVELQFR